MAAHVASVKSEIGFVFGQSKMVGHPHKTDASRFIREFGWRSLPLEDRMRLIVEQTADKH
ncbi:MAG: hypothetical protein CMJ50_01550 [Planctomycetaceae bacterium]|jgi:hypothetical protein|nr:hypothetical protein [Planctomycetaceae bacterium]